MPDFLKGYQAAAHKPMVVEVGDPTDGRESITHTTLVDIMGEYPADEAIVPQTADDPAMMLYSSGTTGRPKGIMISNGKPAVDLPGPWPGLGSFRAAIRC